MPYGDQLLFLPKNNPLHENISQETECCQAVMSSLPFEEFTTLHMTLLQLSQWMVIELLDYKKHILGKSGLKPQIFTAPEVKTA